MAAAASSGAAQRQVCKPIVVGSCAWWLGKRSEETKSHEWTVYVRALPPDEDPSAYIKRVVFQLHPTLSPPTRVLDSPPFEVTEQGWGEFDIHIQIFFHSNTTDKPLDISHMLKLYPDGEGTPLSSSKPVVSERYDEIIFGEPSEDLRNRLAPQTTPSPNGWGNSPNAKWYGTFEPEAQKTQLEKVYQTRVPPPASSPSPLPVCDTRYDPRARLRSNHRAAECVQAPRAVRG